MLKQYAGVFVLGLALALPAQANELVDSTQKLCEKIQSCAVARMGEKELTPQMRQMMQPMLDSMCSTMRSKVKEVPPGDPLYPAALACMHSLEALSCELMQTSERTNTAECDAYEKRVAQSGVQP